MKHERKKGGVRKDKKLKAMHEAVQMRHDLANERPPHHTTDQHDVVPYKSGSAGDKNRHQPPHG